MPAVTSGNYYTFNVSNNAAIDNTMAVLETNYSPKTISTVTQGPTPCSGVPMAVKVTLSAAPSTGENVFIRYSIDNFATSSFVQLSFNGGTTATGFIPSQAASTVVKYYVLSSPSGSPTHSTADMLTLNLNNNAGSNYTYTVGAACSAGNVLVLSTGGTASATYTTLGGAFTAINGGTHTGIIAVYINASTTEAATATLNASGSGSASYSSISIVPTAANLSVSGAIAAGSPLIDLNGADNVTFDGLFSGGNLTISNTTAGTTAGSSTIRFIADATNNIIQNCTISGSSAVNALAAGTILFSTGTATGNDGNVINNNTITAAGANLPTFAIYSAGTSTAIDNSGIQISNNNIQDYYNAANASSGIFVASNSSAWTITGNKLFQTATRTATAGSTHRGIQILTASGGGYTISSNVIGFSASAGTGTTTYAGAFANRFLAIELTCTTTPTSSIQGNTVSGISLSTSSGAAGAPGIFAGISVLAGSVNIGTTSGNIIGATTGTGSISITSTTSLGYCAGIYTTSIGTVSIQNNNIGSISTGGTASIGYAFHGINTAGAAGNFTISGNIIGSTTTANSIAIGTSGTTTTGVCTFNGITNAATGTISINSNTIQNCSSFGTGASIFNGINNTGGSGTLDLTSNNIITGTNSGTGAFTAIANSASVSTANMNTNVIRSNTISSTSGSFTGIINSGSVTTAININNNQLGNASGGLITFSAANSGTLTGISNTAGGTSAALSIQTNDFRGITHSIAGSSSHNYISNTSSGPLTRTYNSNTFTNLNVNTTGSVTFFADATALVATGTCNMNSNSIVTAFNKVGAGGSITINTNNSSSPAGAVYTFNNNNFSNITFTGATTFAGYNNTDGGAPTKTVTGNTFNNITGGANSITCLLINFCGGASSVSSNTITNISCQNSITAISVGGSGAATSMTVASNIINNLSSTGTGGAITAITNSTVATTSNVNDNIINTLSSTGASASVAITSAATTVNIFKNKIYDISGSNASTTISGITVSGGTTITVYNNIIGDLRATAANAANPLIGLNITGGTTVSAYFNTVWLNGTSSGALFGSSAIFASSTPTLDLRDNIFVNTSSITGAGLAVAYRRSLTTLTSYAATSNNNLFYAGTPSASKLIFNDGTNSDQTLTAYKTRVTPRDAASITENPTWVSTTGSSANFLHINTTVATQIESGGTPVSGITTDFDGDTRNVSTPDIGADEFSGIAADLTAPTITYTTFINTLCISNRTLSATITDASGVNTTAGTKPRIYFKKSTNANSLGATNDNTTDGWKYAEASNAVSPFSLTIDNSLIFGGVAGGDVIQYFVVAQDLATTPNVGINSGTFNATPASVALTSTAFPIGVTINSYTILAGGLSGTVTIGAAGTYTSLTGSTGSLFAALNAGGLTGNLTANIIDASVAETGVTALNSLNYGCASNYTLTIKPGSGVTATLTGSSASALIKLNGADFVTIDGSNNGTSSKNLTITNTNAGTSSAVIWNASATASDGATNNTIKNCIITGNASTTTLAGIFSGGTSAVAISSNALFNNTNLTIQNNTISKAQYGIFVIDVTTSSLGTGLLVTGNTLGSSTAGDGFQSGGIDVRLHTGATISNNDVQNITANGTFASNMQGINLQDSKLSTVSGNKVHFMNYSGTSTAKVYGITTSTSTFNVVGNQSSNTYYNNTVYDLVSTATSSSWNTSGINNNGGYNDKYYYNSVYLTGQMSGSTGSASSAAFSNGNGISSTNCPVIDMRNNILYMKGSSTSTPVLYAHYTTLTTYTGSTLNYNDLISTASGTATAKLGFLNSASSADLAAWKTATTLEANSISADPLFNSNTNLQPQPGSPASGAGTPIAGITTDIIAFTRNASTPTIGAYEQTGDFTAPTITYTTLTNTLCTSSRTITATITDASGVNTTAGTKPRVYFRKSTNANSLGATNDNTTDGWKYAEASNAASPFSLTIDPTLIFGGTTGGDIIQYFVVAQDLAATPNVAINSGTFAATPASVALTGTAFPIGVTISSYTLLSGGLSGTVTIGAAGTYTTLTGGGGLFAALNAGGLTGNLTANIIDASVTETGANALNAISYGCASNYTLTIKPQTTATLTGTNAGALIKLNGADFVTIDGSNSGGTDKSLTITNTNTGTSSAVIWNASATASDGATNNTIKNCIITGNASTTTLAGIFSGGTASVSTSGNALFGNTNLTIQNNTVSKAQYGIFVIDVSTASLGTGLVVTGNTLGTSTAGNGFQNGGIDVRLHTGATISNNDVQNITANGTFASNMQGINLQDSKLSTVSGNKVHFMNYSGTSTAKVYGITTSTSTFGVVGNQSSNTYYNNIVYDLVSTATSSSWNTSGINNNGGYNDKYYFNSVYLTGQMSNGSASSAAFSNGNGISSTNCPVIDMRNNILYMKGSSTSTPVLYAHYTTLTTYTGSTLNYNDLISTASGTATAKLGFLNSASSADLAAWKTATTLEANSISADPLFNSNTNLQPQPGSPASAAGIPIAGITTDIIAFTRNASTPTIGAYEQTGDFTAPTITYTTLSNTLCTLSRTFTATITDASGVNTTAGTMPRVYFKKSTNANSLGATNDNTTDGWKYAEASNAASPFSLTIDATLIFGGVTGGDIIQYFVVAQDLAATPNIAINSGTFAATPSSVALTGAAFPIGVTINSYTVLSGGISGTVTIGAAGTYTSLTGAGGLFAAINAGGLTGNLTANIVDASVTETGANALNAINYGCASNYTLTIKPQTTATLTGAVSSGALIKLNGADFVTIDGSNSGGTDKSLTITNTSATSATAIWVASTGTGTGATNNTIKNINIATGSNAATSYGIFVGGTSIGTAGDDNDNLTIQNNTITKAYYGINVAANATGMDDNLVITQNTIGSATSGSEIQFTGIILAQCNNASVTSNTITNILTSGTLDPIGINLSTGVTNTTVNANNITGVNVTNTSGYGGRGIQINTGNTASNLIISNNFISDIKGSGWSSITSDAIMGIAIGNITSTTGGIKLYFNSVNLGSGTFAGNASGTVSAALAIALGVTNLDIRNNILVSNLNNSGASGAKTYAIYTPGTNAPFTTIDYNDYFVSGAQGVLGYLAADKTTLAAIVSSFGGNTNSKNIAPVFTSASDLHLVPGSNGALDNLGTTIAGITTDIDGNTRSATPDMGADEFTPPACSGTPVAGTISPASTTICAGLTTTLTLSGYTTGVSGIAFQWQESAVSGGPYTNVAGGTGATTATYTTAALSSTRYYVCVVTCTNSGLSATAAEVTVTVNPTPTASASSNSPVCTGTTLNLTGTTDVGTTYAWTGPGGYTSTSQNPTITNVTTAAAGTYSFVATLGLCSSPAATTAVVVNLTPSAVTAAAGVSAICTGGSTTLTASGGLATGTTTLSSGTINLAIPDNSSTGVNNTLTVAGVPAGSTIDSVIVTFNVTHAFSGDVEINLEAPNGQIINLEADRGGTSALGFVNTRVTSNTAAPAFSTGSNPFTGTFKADGTVQANLIGSPAVTTSTFSSLFSVINGGWKIRAYDDGSADVGTLQNWSIKIAYTQPGSFSWSPTTGLTPTTGAMVTAAPTMTTTYTATSTANGCSSTSTGTMITVNPLPTPGITNNTGTTILTCSTTSISVTATGGTSYAWSGGLGNTANANITTTGTYTVTVTDVNSCTASTSITITNDIMPPTPGITNNTGTTIITCTTPTISLTATGGGTYKWDDNTTSADRSVSAAGNYTVTVTAANGCTASTSITITSNTTPPTAGITNNTGPSELTCIITSISLTATGGGTYKWEDNSTSPARSIINPGDYTVTVTAANGCTASSSITITINSTPPTAGITNNTGTTVLTCTTTSISLTATGGVSYTWEDNTTNPARTIMAAGDYTVTVMAANGCTASTSITITSNVTPPTPGITNNTGTTELTCITTSISVTATGGGTYKWDDNSTSAMRTLSAAGAYTVTVTAANGCTASTSITIASNVTPPTPGITNNTGTTVLTCTTTSISVTATGGVSYKWDDNSTSAMRTLSAAADYTVTVTAANGCTASTSITITLNTTPPNAGITNNTGPSELTCIVTSISLTATGGGTYVWDNNSTSPTRSITMPGDYTVTVTAANGCTASAGITITSNTTPPNAGIGNDSGNTELTCSITEINVYGTGGGTYLWDNNSTSATRSLTSPGDYTVTVTAANGCTASASITITIDITPPTAVIFTTPNTTVLTCSITSISLLAFGGESSEWEDQSTNATRIITVAGTYTVTVTDLNGCTASTSITISASITHPDAGIANNSGTTQLNCTTTSISLTANGGGTYKWDNNSTNPNRTISMAGDYTVTVTGANGCTASSSITITTNTTPPTAGITNNTGTTVLNCTSVQSISVTATGGGTYKWDDLSTNATRIITLAGTYTVTVTAANGCTASASIVITSSTNPPMAGINNNTGSTELNCTVTSISLTATGGGTYKWDDNSTDPNRTILAAGTYTVTVTAANTCTASASIAITSNTTPPTPGISTNPNTTVLTCTTTTINLTATGGATYKWDDNSTSPMRAITMPGDYTVTVTGANGCTASASITITSNTTPPSAGITNNTGTTILTCTTTSISLTATGVGTYKWDDNSTSANRSVVAAGTYTVTVTAANGCTASASIAITADNTPPSAGITNNTGTTVLTCTTTSISLTATGGGTYKWDDNSTNPAQSITVAGTYTVTVTIANTCTASATITVTSNTTPPSAGITNNTGTTILTCTTTSISLTATGAGTYKWDDNSTLAARTILAAGTYTVTVTAANTCTASATITVTSNTTPPTPGITNNTGTTILTCTTTSISLTATGGGTYKWDDNSTLPARTILAAGNYTVTVTSANGCTASSTIAITSNTTPPTAGITNNTGSTVLNCSSVPSISLTATGGGTYKWDDNSINPNRTIVAAGTYTVTVTAANGCTASSSIIVTSNTAPPTAGITNNTGSTQVNCITPSISLTATGGGTYKWDDNSTNPNRTVMTAGTYTVTVTAANTCTASATISITSNTTPPAAGITNNTGTTILTCTTTSISLTATGVGTYKWDNNSTNAARTIVSPGTYTVTVTSPNGCTASASVVVTSNMVPPVAGITNNTGSTTLDCTITTSISVTATGGGTYKWEDNSTNPARTIVNAGTYTVTVTAANGCTSSSSIMITSNSNANPPSANQIPNQIICHGGNCTIGSFTGSVPGITYTWTNSTPSIGLAASGTGDIPTFVPTSNGVAIITVTPSLSGCVAGPPMIFLIIAL
jgi:hypothetical protein